MTVRVPDGLLSEVDELARQNGMTRSEAVIHLFELGTREWRGYTSVFRTEMGNRLMRMVVPVLAAASREEPKEAVQRLEEVLAIARQDRERVKEESDAEGLRAVPEQ
jgi:metal-responsive CopG/Arc/MetJ family transcriptional regulator